MRRTWLWSGVAVLAAIVAACGSQGESAGGRGGSPPRPEAEAFDEGSGGGAVGAISTAPVDIPAVGPTVIKTADLEVEVERGGLGGAVDRATDVAARYGGFVLSTTTAGQETRRGSLTVRVPSDRFEEALGKLRALGTVERQRVSGEDIGQEFVDLEARLRNLEAQEAVLLRLFDEAVSVTDTIRIQHELSGVQLQIEEIQGRLRYLRDQTALGTITVVLVEEGAAASGSFDRALERAVDGFLGVIAALVVALGYLLPMAALALVVLGIYRRVRPTPAGAGG